MLIFGPGTVTFTPNNVTNPTPYTVGMAQEISYEEASTLKPVYGQNRRALAVGAGTIKSTGKIKVARFSISAMNWLLYGVAPAVGSTATSINQSVAIPSTPYQMIPGTQYTVPGSGTWSADLGVTYVATGKPLTRVTTPSAAGQYSVSAGTYTFYSADTGLSVYLTYNYTLAATGYSSLLGGNPLLGPTVSFGLNITATDPTNNAQGTFQVYNAVISKASLLQTKLEDFSMPEYDYEAFVNAAGNIGSWNTPDIS